MQTLQKDTVQQNVNEQDQFRREVDSMVPVYLCSDQTRFDRETFVLLSQISFRSLLGRSSSCSVVMYQ